MQLDWLHFDTYIANYEHIQHVSLLPLNNFGYVVSCGDAGPVGKKVEFFDENKILKTIFLKKRTTQLYKFINSNLGGLFRGLFWGGGGGGWVKLPPPPLV